MNLADLHCIFEKLAPYQGVSTDSRTMMPGEVFIALDGPNFQGADFAEHALARGACAVVQSRWRNHEDPRILWAESPLNVLYYMAQQRRCHIQGTVFAVTGSVGKTTTKAGLAHVLGTFGSVYASAASYNNHIGVPLTLANTPLDSQYSIFEVGTNHPGEIRELVQYIRPDISMLTAVSEAHIANFGSLEVIAEEKFSIFQGRVGVFSSDCVFQDRLHKRYPDRTWVTFGIEHGDIYVSNMREDRITVQTPQGQVVYKATCTDRHWIESNLIVLAAVHAAGLDVHQAGLALESFHPLKGRGQVVHYPRLKVWCIDDTYNAAPQAMRAGLAAFAQRKVPGRKLLILAEMGELGAHSQALHEALIPYIKALGEAEVFLMGGAFKDIAGVLCEQGCSVQWHEHIASLCAQLRQALLPQDTVWVKGKNSAQLWRVLDALHTWDYA
jgi:UDP-N-acetylmuramoyl-tripeptide--D-alanyl-D-alanine ligase